MIEEGIVLIGYSGHAYVVCDALLSSGYTPSGYCERSEKIDNPYGLQYLGDENDSLVSEKLKEHPIHISIGDNHLRARLFEKLDHQNIISAIHESVLQSEQASIGLGCLLSAGVIINSNTSIGDGVIINTGSIVEHDCEIGDFAHIAPGTVLGGGVSIGRETLVGLGARVLPGITIGANTVIASGTIVTKDIGDNKILIGKEIKERK